jgi:hypothetical protein
VIKICTLPTSAGAIRASSQSLAHLPLLASYFRLQESARNRNVMCRLGWQNMQHTRMERLHWNHHTPSVLHKAIILPFVCAMRGRWGTRGSLVVKALGCKPEGRRFETRWGEMFNLPNPSGRTRPWGFSQPLTEMSTRRREIMVLGSKVRPVRGANNLSTTYESIV